MLRLSHYNGSSAIYRIVGHFKVPLRTIRKRLAKYHSWCLLVSITTFVIYPGCPWHWWAPCQWNENSFLVLPHLIHNANSFFVINCPVAHFLISFFSGLYRTITHYMASKSLSCRFCTPCFRVVSCTKLMADCTLERFQHCPFDLFLCVRRRDLHYWVALVSPYMRSVRTISWEGSFDVHSAPLFSSGRAVYGVGGAQVRWKGLLLRLWSPLY